MQTKWVIAKASTIGKLHIKNDLPCQDSNFCATIGQSDWAIAIVADGAGSYEFSHIGSGKVVKLSYLYFSKLIKKNKWIENNCLPKIDEWKGVAKQGFKMVFNDLEDFSIKENYDLSSLSSTVIVVIYSPLGLLVSHIGDGRAGYRTSDGEWKSMIDPFKGEYANETIFITSPIWKDEIIDNFIESRIISEPTNSFVMMSDGCENICFETTILNETTKQYEHINKPFAGFLNPISKILINLSNLGKTEKEIDLLWEEYLTDGTEELANEEDDKTLVLAVKMEI